MTRHAQPTPAPRSWDLTPEPAIHSRPGQCHLHYEVLAESLPVLKFTIDLNVTGAINTDQARISNY